MYCAANTYFCLVCASIRSFLRVTFYPVSISVNIRGFGPRYSVCMPLSPVRRGLPLSPNSYPGVDQAIRQISKGVLLYLWNKFPEKGH